MNTGELESDDDISRRRVLTARLTLRLPEAADAPALTRLCDNPKVALQTARMPYPYRESDAAAWIARTRNASDTDEVAFLIANRKTGEVIGAAGFGVLEGADPEIGYWIGEPHWGQGFATEAVQALIDFAFTTTTAPLLAGRCRVGNAASRRVLEKCGFQYRGAGMVQSRAQRGWVPTEDFCLERFVWKSLKRWGRQPQASDR